MAKFVDVVNQMSDDDIIKFAENKFLEVKEMLEELASANIPGAIVKGVPGIGKSWFCENILKSLGVTFTDLLLSDYEYDEDTKTWNCVRLETGKGPLIRKSDSRNWNLHADLYANSKPGDVLMLDDNDEIMKDVTGLSLLMSATEHNDIKEVNFTRANFNNELRKYGVPSKFQFNGGVLILTNFDMEGEVRKYNDGTYPLNRKKPPHITRWEALLDRLDYIDMELDHPRLVRVYLEHIVRSKGMYTQSLGYKAQRLLTEEELTNMFVWVRKNQLNLKTSLTFRTLNELVRMISMYDNWEDKAYRKLLKHL